MPISFPPHHGQHTITNRPRIYSPSGTVFIFMLLLILDGCSSTPPSQTQHSVVDTAVEMLGIPYRWGGDSPEEGFDCSGLAYYAYRQIGVQLPRSARAQYGYLTRLDPMEMRPGDLVFFNLGRAKGKQMHVGIYVGGDRFIHAPSKGKTVRYASLSNPFWSRRLIGGGGIY